MNWGETLQRWFSNMYTLLALATVVHIFYWISKSHILKRGIVVVCLRTWRACGRHKRFFCLLFDSVCVRLLYCVWKMRIAVMCNLLLYSSWPDLKSNGTFTMTINGHIWPNCWKGSFLIRTNVFETSLWCEHPVYYTHVWIWWRDPSKVRQRRPRIQQDFWNHKNKENDEMSLNMCWKHAKSLVNVGKPSV